MSNYKITVNHTHIRIDNYMLGDCERLEKFLSLWNPSYFRYEPIGYLYDEEKRVLLIPRGVDINYVEKLLNGRADVNYTPDPYDSVSIKLKTPPRDDVQKKCISFLIGENEFGYTKKYSQMLLNLGTGVGKTYVTTAALTFLGTRAIVITHIEKIKKQWFDTLTGMTDLSERDVCNINNSKTIDRLLMSSNLKYKVYLVNHATILSYAKKNGWDSIHELFIHLKIGLKVYDEAHLNFENIVRIDLSTNTKRTIYLTATFERSDFMENNIFKMCFKNVIRYGSELKKEKRKHIVYLSVLYNSKPSLDTQAYMVTFRGFNKIRYAEYLSTCQKFYDALAYVLNYFKDKEGKTMIISTTIDNTEEIKKFVENIYENKSVSVYHSKISEEEHEKALTADVISTTPKSAGTGLDIPGLRTVIMTESYSSTVQADQTSGRLREYSENDYTFYVELVDIGFKRVYDMYKKRLPVFKKKCVKVLSINL